jgi:hypothetical protein
LPDTDYAVTYYKPASSAQLLAKSFPRHDDGRTDFGHHLVSLAPEQNFFCLVDTGGEISRSALIGMEDAQPESRLP